MATLPDIAGAVGVHLSMKQVSSTGGGRGIELAGPCPKCGGEDRFRVWPEQRPDSGGTFWCRKCFEFSGDGLQFLMDYGVTFKEACRIVGKELGATATDSRKSGGAGGSFRRPYKSTPVAPKIKDQHNYRKTPLKPRECPDPCEKWQKQAVKYIEEGQAALMSNPAALAKLERERGITPATAELFHLGLLLPREKGRMNCRFSSRKLWGLPPKEKAKKPNSLWLPRGLIIPAPLTPAVNTPDAAATTTSATDATPPEFARIRIRRPDVDIQNGKGSKYFVVPGSGMAPLIKIEKQPAIVVTESELDAILIYQEVGNLCGVLSMGNAQAHPDHATVAVLEKIPLIILALDNDQAGIDAAARWRGWFPHSVCLELPNGIKDPGELHQNGGNLREWISAALPSPWRVPPRAAAQPAAEPNHAPPISAPMGAIPSATELATNKEYLSVAADQQPPRPPGPPELPPEFMDPEFFPADCAPESGPVIDGWEFQPKEFEVMFF